MNETTVTIIVALITAFGSVITALLGRLAGKGMNYLDQKTKFLDEKNETQKKEAIKKKITDVVTQAARSTLQTYVDELKQKSADGKLTKQEASQAFKKTSEQALSILKADGVEIAGDILNVAVEAVVGELKVERKTLELKGVKPDPAAAGARITVPEL